jgi:hypothetical protein
MFVLADLNVVGAIEKSFDADPASGTVLGE